MKTFEFVKGQKYRLAYKLTFRTLNRKGFCCLERDTILEGFSIDYDNNEFIFTVLNGEYESKLVRITYNNPLYVFVNNFETIDEKENDNTMVFEPNDIVKLFKSEINPSKVGEIYSFVEYLGRPVKFMGVECDCVVLNQKGQTVLGKSSNMTKVEAKYKKITFSDYISETSQLPENENDDLAVTYEFYVGDKTVTGYKLFHDEYGRVTDVYKATAKCAPTDTFDAEFGMDLCYARLTMNEEFENQLVGE